MKDEFVKTKNVKVFFDALSTLSMRGAREACLMVVDGLPGLGKTAALNWWCCRQECIYVRAKKEWTPNWMMRDIISALGEIPSHSFEKMFTQAMNLLAQRASDAERDGRVFALVIDEVDYISRSSKLLESIRDLSDFVEIPIILVGMGVIRHNLARFPQVASRIGQYKDPRNNIQKYLRALKAAGYILETPKRLKGESKTSNGFKQYVLVRDTGNKTPILRPRTNKIYDPNTSETYSWKV